MTAVPRPSRFLALGTVAGALAVGGACSEPTVHEASNDLPPVAEREVGEPEIQTSGPEIIRTGNLLVAPGAAEAAIADITAALGAVQVTSFDLYDHYAIFEAQDPAKPENIDRYTYRDGVLEDPEPVHVDQSLLDDLPNRLFSLSEVNWAAVSALSATALVELAIEDGEPNHLGVDRGFDGGPVELSLSVSGPRRSGYADATADGTVVEVRLL
jgi:hypothetical protein